LLTGASTPALAPAFLIKRSAFLKGFSRNALSLFDSLSFSFSNKFKPSFHVGGFSDDQASLYSNPSPCA